MMMKKVIFFAFVAATALFMTLCRHTEVKVTVKNPAQVTYEYNTVELPWIDLTAKVKGLTPENVVVSTAEGVKIPSQVLYEGESEPQKLIFQVTLEGGASALFSVAAAIRENYPSLVYGRFVPERLDDYAWENNLVAYRTYGPALEKLLVTNGIDFWSKSTSEMVIERWYEKDLRGEGSYHVDLGEGCDVYRVGPTLGMGASAPVVKDSLVYSRNFAAWKRLDNGPIRTSFELTYAPWQVDGKEVELTKIISLDAHTHFNKSIDIYQGAFAAMTIAAGVAIHDSVTFFNGINYSALYEAASDSREGYNGFIGGAVILPGSEGTTISDCMVRTVEVRPNVPMVYYFGAGTSKFNMTDAKKWNDYVARKAAELALPLVVELK